MNRILIADDEPHVIRILKLALERAGYRVDSVLNGEAALAQVLEDPPAALITDIQMPRMTGQELCCRLHEEMPERTFPILVMTSRVEREHRQWAAALPDVEFLEKPLSPRKVVDILGRLLGPAGVALG
jgi:CheY-like chemotaxis protein